MIVITSLASVITPSSAFGTFSPEVGKKWESQIPRRRVKVWTQPDAVMVTWRDPKIFLPDKPVDSQGSFLSWVKNNVDFGVRMRRVD